jgi:hypothetical protein
MKRFGYITTLDANRDLGVTRLSATIFNLRKKYEIPGETIKVKNRFGETTHVTKYMLAEEKFIQENENHIPCL